MARKDKLGLKDHKAGLKRLKTNATEAGKDVPLGVAKELSSILAYSVREVTGAQKRTTPFKSNVAKGWFE
ncbi:hypothetical protein [Dinoroseobacter sp. S76]|uniref:hypothetical protein n=1 Tax=Dinoroseobacter sp. S76 TaxID=3415124 RepID=UPI003C7A3FC8